MDFTQNKRIAQVNEQTLIIGVDVAKRKHVARAIDDRGRDLVKRLVFTNSYQGFLELIEWAQNLSEKHNRPNLLIGMEPTGHYWLNLAYYLKARDIPVVVVNPMKVKRFKEMDDDSPTKNDTKDAKVIAQVMRDGRYHEPTLPEDVYAELREGMKLYDMIQEDIASIKAQMHNALDRYFPEFLTVFKDWTGKAALHLLDKGYLPEDIRAASEESLLLEVKQAATRAVGIKRIQALKEAAKHSVGLQVGLRMGRQEIRYLLDQYKALEERRIALEAQLKELVLHIPGADQMMTIKGVSAITVAGFFC